MKLNRCPICRYSLRGLPVEHKCPECGFEYDQETSVFYPRWKPRFIFLVVCVVTVIALWTYVGSIGVYGTVGMVITLLSTYYIWHLRNEKNPYVRRRIWKNIKEGKKYSKELRRRMKDIAEGC